MELPTLLKRIIRAFLPNTWQGLPQRLNDNSKALHLLTVFLARQQYDSIAEIQDHRHEISKFEFKIYSQNGEDGILLYIFSRVGTANRCFVEFGVEDGRECNTAALSICFGWHGLLMDCNEEDVAAAKRYYGTQLGATSSAVKIIQCWVTAENINKVMSENGIEGEIDLLSIDIDGNDYWVWKALTSINPRVVVIEYNASLGARESLTVKYDPHFARYKKHPSGFYHGASLPALNQLAKAKGYVLVGCDSAGVNAFFVREDVADGKLPEVSPQEAYFPLLKRSEVLSTEEQFECIKHLPFDYV